jgi:hypothetical protein
VTTSDWSQTVPLQGRSWRCGRLCSGERCCTGCAVAIDYGGGPHVLVCLLQLWLGNKTVCWLYMLHLPHCTGMSACCATP